MIICLVVGNPTIFSLKKAIKMKVKSFSSIRASLAVMIALMTTYSFVCMSKNCFSAAMVFIVEEGL